MQLTALALWLNTAFAGFDEAVATAIHQLYVAAGWFFTPFLSFISLLGKGGIFLILLSIALMLFRKTRRNRRNNRRNGKRKNNACEPCRAFLRRDGGQNRIYGGRHT